MMAEDSFDEQIEIAELSLSGKTHRNDRGKEGRGSDKRAGPGREVQISKALSKLLRHAAVEEGIELDDEGFAKLDQVLKWKRLQSMKATFSDIQTAITDNTKQRFALKPDPSIDPAPDPSSDTDPTHYLIRANQGHSIAAIASAALLTPITLAADNIPVTVVHGTYYASYAAILSSGGLKRMGRNHVHFGTGLPEDSSDTGGVISGMRADAEILIYIDVRKSLEDGGAADAGGALQWWMSENGVVLTEGDADGLVPTRYWRLVRGRRQEVGVLWEDGVEVAELPQSVRGRRAPSGEGPAGRRRRGAGEGENRKARGRGKEKENVRRGGPRAMKELDAVGGGDTLGTGEEEA